MALPLWPSAALCSREPTHLP